jgi:TetR/AcrR family transcriptional repressor of mexJK operon
MTSSDGTPSTATPANVSQSLARPPAAQSSRSPKAVPARRKPGRPRAHPGDVSTYEGILNRAGHLFLELGFEGMSMSLIARECGVTKATIYYHFPTKGSLFTLAMLRLMERIRARTRDALLAPGDLRGRLERIAVLRLNVPLPHTDFRIVVAEAEGALTDEQLTEMRRAEEELAQMLAAEFEKAMAAGEVRHINPLLAAHTYLSLLSVGKTQDATGQPVFADVETTARAIVDLLWHGLGA